MKMTVIFLILILNLSITSFAYDYNGTHNFLTWIDESYYSGKTTWDETKLSVYSRLNRELMDSTPGSKTFYTYDNLKKEYAYFYYVFTTNGRPYEEYYDFMKKLLLDYTQNGIIHFYTPEKEEIYLHDLRIYSLYRNNCEIDGDKLILLADSGLDTRNVLPIYNFGIRCVEEIGNCAGLDYLSVLSYKQDKMLLNTNFNSVYFIDNYEKINHFNLSNYTSIIEGHAYDFVPNSDKFKLIYKNLSDNVDLVFNLDDFKNTEDYELLKSILLLQKWGEKNFTYQTASSFLSFFYYTQDSLCPISELELIKNELNNGNPLIVTVSSKDNSGHNLIGYKLYQNMNKMEYYYLQVIDTNYLNNLDLYVLLYSYNGKLYALYSPHGLSAENKYVYDKKVEFSTYNGKLLHKSNTDLFWNKDYNPKVLPY